MSSIIEIAHINILNGVLSAEIPLNPGLNFISGENGTLKTKLLQEIKAGRFRPPEASGELPQIMAISPKRNSERRAIDQVFQTMRQQNRTLDKYLQEKGGAQINETTFENYPSIGELFFYVFEVRARDGGSQTAHMSAVTEEFNQAIGSVFSDYRIESEWNSGTGTPRLILVKKQDIRIPIEALSTGEEEVLSLITNLYASRDAYDIFLIDEPEVHLNWHLEDRLFHYLAHFCEAYKKQMIVSTHSRVIFKSEFLPLTNFLYWNDEGRVILDKDMPPEHRRRLAGETVEIIRLGDFSHTTFFVEDNAHEMVIRELATALGAQISVTVCGNAPNVRSLFARSKADGGWQDSYFVEDGDNENSPFPDEGQFIHLPKYCIENHLLDVGLLSSLTNKSADDIRKLILAAVLSQKERILAKNKFFEFLLDQLSAEDLTEDRVALLDASIFLPYILRDLDLTFDSFLQSYVQEAQAQGGLEATFPQQLVSAIGHNGEAEQLAS